MRNHPVFQQIQRPGAFLLLFFASLCPVPAGAGAMDHIDRALAAGFVPHKALYEIKLVGTHSGSQVLNIGGQMFYEWDAKCDAWGSNHRFNLFYEYADSPAMQITSDFATYETHDGKSMDFTSQRRRDGALFEELRGHAALNDDKSGKAVYTRPEELVFELPEGSVFPMEHSLQVVENIHKGKKFYKAVIFDGSDEAGPVEVSTFIGGKVNVADVVQPSKNIDASLLTSPAHNLRLAFFPMSDPSLTSDYEMSLVFHENGVISDMMVEYHDFSVSQKLVALERLDGGCEEVSTEK
jgi:hypothetical protein